MKALAYPFNLSPSRGSIAMTSNYEAVVRGQIVDALMTNQGERVMRPRYGCDIQSALHDPTSMLEQSDAAAIIKSRLETYVPRAAIRSVSISSVGSEVTVTVNYRPSPYAEDTNVAVPIASEFLNRQALSQQRSNPT